jgi:molybdate transport system ATP-binding protein
MGLSVFFKKQFNGFDIDVTWEIGNELAVLFGFSGAGKTVTLQMIAGLVSPDKGYIRSGGNNLFDSDLKINLPPQNRRIGYVFQDLALFPHMTVEKNIAYGLNGSLNKNDRRQKIDEIISLFQLRGLEKRFPSEISGGQKQRTACARALIKMPDALLLDEPFCALDNPIRVEMQKVIKDIQQLFNIPVIFVTHDIFEAVAIADKIIVYSNGRVHQIGPPEKVMNNPATSETAALVHAWRRINSGSRELTSTQSLE